MGKYKFKKILRKEKNPIVRDRNIFYPIIFINIIIIVLNALIMQRGYIDDVNQIIIYEWTTEYELSMRKDLTIKTDVDSQNRDYKKNYIKKNDNNNTVQIYSDNLNNNNQNDDNNNEETVCCSGCNM